MQTLRDRRLVVSTLMSRKARGGCTLLRKFAAERVGHVVAGGGGRQVLQLEVRLVEVVVAGRARRRQQVHRAVRRALRAA